MRRQLARTRDRCPQGRGRRWPFVYARSYETPDHPLLMGLLMPAWRLTCCCYCGHISEFSRAGSSTVDFLLCKCTTFSEVSIFACESSEPVARHGQASAVLAGLTGRLPDEAVDCVATARVSTACISLGDGFAFTGTASERSTSTVMPAEVSMKSRKRDSSSSAIVSSLVPKAEYVRGVDKELAI